MLSTENARTEHDVIWKGKCLYQRVKVHVKIILLHVISLKIYGDVVNQNGIMAMKLKNLQVLMLTVMTI